MIVHEDKVGFLPRRHLKNNIRTLINVLECYERHSEEKMALVFIDTQKAFDNINWDFILQSLEQMNFGPKVTGMTEGIHSKQKAKIRINGKFTKEIQIRQGTRQGCPLSPLLFILILETLNSKIRGDTRIRRLKIQAYADDLMIILEDPLSSIKFVIGMLEDYGQAAALKINDDKTKLLVKRIREFETKLLKDFGFQMVNKIRYLGIMVTKRTITLEEDIYI